MTKPIVKVCCISSLTEAYVALEAGADWLGLVSEMPSGPGVISLDEIAEIVERLPSETRTVLLTSKLSFDEIFAQHHLVKTWGIQLVDRIPRTELEQLRKALPKTHLIQVVHVRDKASISEARSYESLVDAILLDSGKPDAKDKTLGGTGETHDWDISKQVCAMSSLPVLLAGGLNSENVSAAKCIVHPSGFDLCSGVRTDGNLDRAKLKIFMHLVHKPRGFSK